MTNQCDSYPYLTACPNKFNYSIILIFEDLFLLI